jgi:hypothetical protein
MANMNEGLSQGDFNVTRLLDGSVRFSCPPVFVVAPLVASWYWPILGRRLFGRRRK